MDIVLKGATLIDGTGRKPIKNSLVIISENVIAYAGGNSGVELPENAAVIDLAGKTLIPGLIDLHIHMDLHGFADTYAENLVEDKLRAIRTVQEMNKTLQGGITTVRNCGSVNHIDFAVREAVEMGWVEGPRIITSGKIISMTAAGNDYFLGMYREADGCDEVRKAAREQLKAGADFLKLMATGAYMNPGGVPGASQLSRAEMAAVVEEADKLGLHVAAHAHGRQGIIDAIEAGVKTIEHGTFIDDQVIELMLQRGIYLVPTYVVGFLFEKHAEAEGIPCFMIEKNRQTEQLFKNNLRRAIAAGVKVAFGSDAGTNYNYHGQNALELVLLAEDGLLTPMAALESGTRVAAEALGLDDQIGTVETGKQADLAVINGSLDQNLQPLINKVEMVYKAGKRVR